MDEKMGKTMTVLEAIIADVSQALFQKWANALPEDQRSEENLNNLSKNAQESTFFVVKMFMDKFNEAAEEIKNIPDPLTEQQ
jgi:predicted ArsR family transcriptional regulator